ncbi:PREDICTED: transmembrane protein 56 isoform X3 [Chinchilla lanigera]|uniref:transmembrane protein 56 isoform X3 n=1 Tax=Chinchilla lanigera TaxID=34839 RepID=UPI000695C5E4|nr:PREDICTED: transmembrane protein 56 isoform X3 [Chinchilla lanigera]
MYRPQSPLLRVPYTVGAHTGEFSCQVPPSGTTGSWKHDGVPSSSPLTRAGTTQPLGLCRSQSEHRRLKKYGHRHYARRQRAQHQLPHLPVSFPLCKLLVFCKSFFRFQQPQLGKEDRVELKKCQVLEYVANFRLLAELSSPFVNQRWFFEALKYPKFSKANVVNGILMTVVFFIVRIAVIPPYYSFLYSVYGTEPFIRLGFVIQYSWVSTCIVLDVMNVMWMIKIYKGCIKVISLLRQEKANNSLQNGKLD